MRLWLLFPLCIAAVAALFVAFAYLPTALKPAELRAACNAHDGTEFARGICRE